MPHDEGVHPVISLLGKSASIQHVREQIDRAAQIQVPVLITGESGTGKEIAARLLHSRSERYCRNFVKVNCPAIPNELFESEFFGHEAGAFTGAGNARAGKFEQAHKGTLFLDEIGELALRLQAKLLQAIQDFRVARLGGSEERQYDIRLICATNRDMEAQMTCGAFRADLFYRMNVLRIEMPALRDRSSDVPLLLDHFLRFHSDRFHLKPPPLSESILQILENYHWPGNIRELENLAKRFMILGGEEHIISALDHGTWTGGGGFDPVDLLTPLRIQSKRAVQNLERRIILGVLQAHHWNRRKAARTLDISYRALLYKIKDAGFPSLRNRGFSIEHHVADMVGESEL